MPVLSNIFNHEIDVTGETVDLNRYDTFASYVFTGSGTLTGGVNIRQNTGQSPVEGLSYNIWYEGDIDYSGGNQITIFGRPLTATEAKLVLDIEALYVDGGWSVTVVYVTSQNVKRLEVTSAGGSALLDSHDSTDYIVQGTATLLSSYTIDANPSTLPEKTTTVRILWNGNITLDGNDVTIYGLKLTQQQALQGRTVVESTYDVDASPAAWVTTVLESASNGSRRHDGTLNTELNGGDKTIQLDPNVDSKFQELSGTGSLTGTVVVSGSGTPRDGDEFFVKYSGSFTDGGGSITIFGVSLTDQEIKSGDLTVHAWCDTTIGFVWKVQKYSAIQYGQTELIVIPVSFETDEIGTISVTPGFAFKITKVIPCVGKTIENSDNGALDMAISGSSTTPNTIAITGGAAVGDTFPTDITANNVGGDTDKIDFTTSKSTPGGRCVCSVLVTRVAP